MGILGNQVQVSNHVLRLDAPGTLGGISTSDAPRPVGNCELQIERALRGMGDLLSLLSALEVRLDPVLSPRPPGSIAAEQSGSVGCGNPCGLAAQIAGLAEGLDEARRHVNRIGEAVDL